MADCRKTEWYQEIFKINKWGAHKFRKIYSDITEEEPSDLHWDFDSFLKNIASGAMRAKISARVWPIRSI